MLLGDVPVLAKDAAQIAQPEEDRSRAIPAPEAILLTKMREGARDCGVPAGVADTRFIEQPIYMAIPGAGAAVFQFRERGVDAGGEFPLPIRREIGRLKVADEESGFHVPTGANYIGSIHCRKLMSLQPSGWR
jgi:hypothetical protein